MFSLVSFEYQTKRNEAKFLIDEIQIKNELRFYCLWMRNCFLCHKEYIINASEFHYNRSEKTKVSNQFHDYGISDGFYTSNIYLK